MGERVEVREGRMAPTRDAPGTRPPPPGDDGDPPADGPALLSGSTKHLAMPDLLQLLCMNGTEGILALAQGPHTGRVVLGAGRIVHAECGPAVGVKALYRMFDWSAASFRLLPRERTEPPRTIDAPTAKLVMEGLVSVDEWHRLACVLPPAEVRVAPVPGAFLELEHSSAIEREVVGRAGCGSTIGEILDADPRPDSQVAAALCECLKRAVLRTLD